MNTKILVNPFYLYTISFGLSLIIYSWEWSELYPPLSTSVLTFLCCTFLIAIYLGNKVQDKIEFTPIQNSKNHLLVCSFILFSYIVEFIYNGGVPLFLLLRGIDISYMEFGIPTFHVFLHTFTSFYTIYLYHQYRSKKSSRLVLLTVLLLIPNILIINRGALIMTMTACTLIYLLSIRKLLVQNLYLLIISASIFFFGFGYLGNQRSFNGDPLAFLSLTDASASFVDSNIPKEYYWFYIYASSPFANFQNSTLTSTNHRYDIIPFISWELMPDFISKRIVPVEDDYDGKNRLDYSINPILTVGSVYFEPFIRFGWAGPIIVFLFYCALLLLYIMLLSKSSNYFLSGISILCVISVFNIFENMLNFSGLSVQLLYPILLSIIQKNFRLTIPTISIIVPKIKFKLLWRK